MQAEGYSDRVQLRRPSPGKSFIVEMARSFPTDVERAQFALETLADKNEAVLDGTSNLEKVSDPSHM